MVFYMQAHLHFQKTVGQLSVINFTGAGSLPVDAP